MAVANPKRGPKTDKPWRDALMVAVNRYADGEPQTKRLAIIASKVVEKAMEGDMTAAAEIANRLDGKAPQSIDVDHTFTIDLTNALEAAKARALSPRCDLPQIIEAQCIDITQQTAESTPDTLSVEPFVNPFDD